MNKEEDIKRLLEIYKSISLDILKVVEHQNYNSLDIYIDKRQDLVNQLQNLNYNPKEYSQYIKDLNLKEIEENIKILMNKHFEEVRDEIKQLEKGQLVNKMYNKNLYTNYSLLDVKV